MLQYFQIPTRFETFRIYKGVKGKSCIGIVPWRFGTFRIYKGVKVKDKKLYRNSRFGTFSFSFFKGGKR